MKAPILICSVLFILLCKNTAAKALYIWYTPSTNAYTPGTTIPTLSPANSGGVVAPPGYGTGTALIGVALSNPCGMGINPSGNIYVTNYANSTVSEYNSSGIYLNTFGTTALSNPQGITLGGRFVERGYRIISSPVNIGTAVNGNNVYGLNYIVGSTAGQTTTANSTTNAFITGCIGGSTSAGNPSIYLYRGDLPPSNATFTSGNYIGITNITNSTTAGTIGASNGGTHSIPVGNGVPFFFRGNATNWTGRTKAPYVAPENVTLTSKGPLNQGNITVNAWFTPAAGFVSSVTRYCMVGNPYPSSIDLETSTYGNSPGGIITSNLDAAFYELNPVNQQFEPYLASLHTGVGKATNIIVSGQGFFVRASNSGTATLQFTEAAKSEAAQNTGTNLLMGKPAEQAAAPKILRLKLITDTLNYSDIVVAFNSTATTDFNGKEDAKFLSGSSALESLSSDNIALAINVLPFQKQTRQTIKLKVLVAKSGQYSFERTALKNIPLIYEVWLMDNYKKDSLDLRANSTYVFNVDLADTNSFKSNRFKLEIRQNPALGIHLLNFTATKATNGVQVEWKTENEENYTNFTVERSNDEGKTFAVVGGAPADGGGSYSIFDKMPPTGTKLYRLKIEDLNGTITYSNIVRLIYGNNGGNDIANNNISVYPNPTTGPVSLIINKSSGAPSFNIRIVNNIGALIKESNAIKSSWQTDMSRLLPGAYFIQVINKNDNSLVGKTTIVKL